MMAASAVILDPYHPYAVLLIQRLWRNHGVTTVCLHTNWKHRFRAEGRLPILRSPAIAAHYMLSDPDMASVAEHLRARHDIAGVLPFEEGMVWPLSDLAQHLGLSWAQPQIQHALRNKVELKSLVARNDPQVRLNVFQQVTSAEQVLDAVRQYGLTRYVLKPIDGSGNTNVCFFDTESDPDSVRAYFDAARGEVLLEEFIDGQEFWVNGQMDAHGNPTVVGIGRYYRSSRNGVENLDLGKSSVGPEDPHFEILRDYASAVMRAIGLRRSPFHLEAIVDDRGPCLVEVGGRFCGELGVLRDMAHHGPPLDLIDIAAHYYISDQPLGPLPLNWERVRSFWIAYATGDSDRDQRLVRVDGADRVEQSPHFLYWVRKPAPGDFVHRTTSLTTRAWAVALAGSHDFAPRTVIDWARQTVHLHGTQDGSWTVTQKLPMYRGLVHKAWDSRPWPYQLRALANTLG